MAKAGYSVRTTSAVALTAATARTSLVVITPSSFGGDLVAFSLGFDGVTAANVPVFWEIFRSTNATNSTPGTNNTSETSAIQQIYGRSITTGFTAFSASTAGNEPTALTVVRSNWLTPNGGLLMYDVPLGKSIEWDVSAGLGVRLTAPNAVNARVEFIVERV